MVFENQNLCCLGKIKSPDEEFLCVQEVLDDSNREKASEGELTLTKNDIYKDLRAVGYDYGENFRGLMSIGTADFKTMDGKVKWDGNWVTFMDSLLQTMGVAMPFRRLMVPVMIKRLRCDPKVLYEGVAKNKVVVNKEKFDEEVAINEVVENKKEEYDKEFENIFEMDNNKYIEGVIGSRFHIYESVLPFHVDLNSRMIVANGVEIEDLMALPIPRKTNVQDQKLESYEFLANEDQNAIAESDKQYLMDYIKVCYLSSDSKFIFIFNQSFVRTLDRELKRFFRAMTIRKRHSMRSSTRISKTSKTMKLCLKFLTKSIKQLEMRTGISMTTQSTQ